MTVLYSNSLKVSGDLDGGVTGFNSGLGLGDTNSFDTTKGYQPGRAGRMEMTAAFTAGEKTNLETAGTITMFVSKNAITIDDDDPSVVEFTQSQGQANTNNIFLLTCFPAGGTSAGRFQIGKIFNGTSTAVFRGDGTNADLSSDPGTTTVGKDDYIKYQFTWTNGCETVDIWVDCVKWITITNTMDFTAVVGNMFDFFLIGGDTNRGIDDAGGNDIFIKDLTIEDTYYNPAIDKELAIVGDSFVLAGGVNGVSNYDAGLVWEIERFFMKNQNLRVNAVRFATSGEGYSPDISASNLSGEVTSAIGTDPDWILLAASVNDLQDDGNADLIGDYQSSMEGYVDEAVANSLIEKIFVSSVMEWTKAGDPGSAPGNWTRRESKTTSANAILSGLNGRSGTIFTDVFTPLGGFDYNLEFTIATAIGTPDNTDFHLSPEGHSATGRQMAEGMAATGVIQINTPINTSINGTINIAIQ